MQLAILPGRGLGRVEKIDQSQLADVETQLSLAKIREYTHDGTRGELASISRRITCSCNREEKYYRIAFVLLHNALAERCFTCRNPNCACESYYSRNKLTSDRENKKTFTECVQ